MTLLLVVARARAPIIRSGLLLAVALRIAFVEHDARHAGRLEAPDRRERRELLARGIEHGSGAEREVARREHLDRLGAPRERRLRLVVEALPERGDVRGPVQGL